MPEYVSWFFRSIKHYFLLDQGDFIIQFMDMAEEEMIKSMDGILLLNPYAMHLYVRFYETWEDNWAMILSWNANMHFSFFLGQFLYNWQAWDIKLGLWWG